MDSLPLLGNLLTPPVLFFLLGLGAGLARSDLVVPEAVGKGLALYLMVAIGFKGGGAVAASGVGTGMAATVLGGVGLSFLLPFAAFAILCGAMRVDRPTAAAIAGHYGSVSVVTFVTAAGFLTDRGVAYEGYMPAVMALMETPAILSALYLARRGRPVAGRPALRSATLVREVALNGSVVVLLGSFLIGWAAGDKGQAQLAPFVGDLFPGVLSIFLLDMGLIAARQLAATRALTAGLVGFGLVMPLLGAAVGLALGWALGLSLGGLMLFAVLAASASYIAVPAVMRLAVPEANPGIYVTLSLAVTFPFNILLGIPMYFGLARLIVGP